MILWINGAFGAGKSETAQRIHRKIPCSHLYDPEWVGTFLWEVFPASMRRKGDFQDIPAWRTINYEIIRYLCEHYHGDLIIPMTITNAGYYREIVGRLQTDGVHVWHCILLASGSTLQSRLLRRGERPGSWAERQIERCIKALETMCADFKIETDCLGVDEVADRILTASGIRSQDMP